MDKRAMLHSVLVNELKVYHHAEAEKEADIVFASPACRTEEGAKEALKEEIEKLSGGENTVLYDGAGLPNVMARVPLLRWCDVLDGCESTQAHPAFAVGEKELPELWISKYPNCLMEGVPVSLPMACPARVRDYNEALALAGTKGEGWCLTPFQLHEAVALWARRGGFLPSGNNEGGRNYFRHDETGEMADDGMVLSGSGPWTWTHNGKPSGIWDLNGNINDWVSGFRLMDGQLQFIEPQKIYAGGCDQGTHSPLWQAMNTRGELVPADAEDTLYFDAWQGTVRLTTRVEGRGLGNCAYGDVQIQEGLSVPPILQVLGLYPQKQTAEGVEGWRWINTEGEALPLCGGAYKTLDHGGIFFAGVTKPRGIDYPLAGVRCMYGKL